MSAIILLLGLLCSLVEEVHSQTEYPYVSFMGEILPNHAYVDLTAVGEDIDSDPGNTVRCHTDLSTCCHSIQGLHRGDRYFPDHSVLANAVATSDDIYKRRGDHVIHLRRRNDAMSPSGIYHCEIPTITVHDDVNTITGETVYIGLYPPSGDNQ